MIRNDAILTPERLDRIRAAWECGKVLEDLAYSHGVSLAVLRRRMRKHFQDLNYGTPNVHPYAIEARYKAMRAGREREFDEGLAAWPMPGVEGVEAPEPLHKQWPR